MDEKRLIAFFKDLHRHPELGWQEFRTTDRIRQALDEGRFEAFRRQILDDLQGDGD